MAQLLTFLKPDAVLRTNVGATIVKALDEHPDLNILSFEKRQVDAELSRRHYAHVADRPFYPWLERYVTATPVFIMLTEVADEAAVERLRQFLGATISHQAAEGTLRGRFGIYAGVNCLHLSDSIGSGAKETTLWKQRLEIGEGCFDLSLQDFTARYDESLPNHTLAMRRICLQVANHGEALAAQRLQVRSLLQEECPQAEEEPLQRLTDTIVGSALN